LSTPLKKPSREKNSPFASSPFGLLAGLGIYLLGVYLLKAGKDGEPHAKKSTGTKSSSKAKKTYEAGSGNTYPFSIPTPNLSDASEPKRPTDWKGETLKKAEIEWLLYAQLEAKGLHITDTKDIAVHP